MSNLNAVFVKPTKDKKQPTTLQVDVVPASIEDMKNTLNPYIPLFMNKTPWYAKDDPNFNKPIQKELGGQEALNKWYDRGKTVKKNKVYKGGCENCGANTHKKKDCVERPRRKGAKWTGKDIKDDEYIQEISLDFDGKRDRWNGYDPQQHLELIKDHQLVEQKRLEIRARKTKEKMQKLQTEKPEMTLGLEDLSSDSSDDEKYGDNPEVLGQRVDEKERVTVRNLRLREDTAKYLLNLDEKSAAYNPKTRSMMEQPLKDGPFVGDNFIKYTGEVRQANQMMQFAWDAEQTTGIKMNIASDPTQGEYLYKKFHEQGKFKSTEPSLLIDKYGGGEYLNAPKELLMSQSEQYLEYSAKGELIKGQATVKKSKYLENVYNNNHTTVWGSWYSGGEWGYKCCHSMIKNSYCGGAALIEAKQYTRDIISKRPELPAPTSKPEAVKQNPFKRDEKDEMEEYHLKKIMKNDPMAKYL